jgi:hypothetical protein
MKITLETSNGIYTAEEPSEIREDIIQTFSGVLLSAGFSLPKGAILGYEYEEEDDEPRT